MSLQRQLLVIMLCLISMATITQAGFLSLQRVLIKPSQHPALILEQTAHIPTQVSIPHQANSLPIFPSLIQNGEWPVYDQGVSLLQSSSSDQTGHIMYGHNWSNVLGQLHQAQIGEEISLTYQNGQQEVYTIKSVFTVSADRLDVLELAGPQKLLIYTCTGFLDTKRLVVLAERTEADISYVTK